MNISLYCKPPVMHTVSFDWFLSGLEWILNLEFCLLSFWYFTKKYYGISDLGLTLPHFELLGLYLDMFDQNWSFLHKKMKILIKHIQVFITSVSKINWDKVQKCVTALSKFFWNRRYLKRPRNVLTKTAMIYEFKNATLGPIWFSKKKKRTM